MKIGNVELENNVFLAPMAGVTDQPFRILCREMGCGLVYSEMVSAKGMMHNNKNTEKLLQTSNDERPCAVQLFGSDPEILADMAIKAQEYADIIDINKGCPAPKITKNGEGSALMLKPQLVGKIVRSVSRAIDKPLTVKFRKGYDEKNLNALEIAMTAEENGAAAVTIHGRTREQYYSGNADWNIIKEIKKNVKIPVIGNGDVTSPEKAKEMLEYTGCDAVMIGRAAQGNPWIFKRVVKYLKDGELLPEPSAEEKIKLAMRHFEMLSELKGEYIGLREMRQHLGKYIKGMYGSSEIRMKINTSESKEEIFELLMKLIYTGEQNKFAHSV
ncbi:MAG: tRNA dihydrouridine synthase DusB [Firmicutes bacterium]|nr:tRNA dihydrouridine synthase DusB [Bacillota bacterium]